MKEGFDGGTKIIDPVPSIEHASIEQLRVPIQKILEELRPEIEKAAYGMVLSDDVSGRIPALMLGWALKRIYKQNGNQPPLFRTLVGMSRESRTDITKRQKRKENLEQ